MTDPKDLEAVRALLQRSRDGLLKQYEASGVGVGKEQECYVIVVFLKSAERRPAEAVQLEGVALKFEVTGPFKTQNR